MSLSISEVARRTGLSTHNLRYYDSCGLLPEVERTANGYRQFTEDDLEWINILKCLKATEMPLTDIQTFTDLVQQGTHTASERLALLQAHRAEVEARLQEIQNALSVIDGKIAHYSALNDNA